MKTCTRCKENKEFIEFYSQKGSKNNLNPVCKVCVREKSAEYRRFNYKKAKASVSNWQKKNTEKAIASSTAYYKANLEKVKTQNHIRYLANADKIIAKQSAYQKANPDKIKDQQLRIKFGITLDQYNKMLEAQEHKCAICYRHRSEFKKGLAVDHNRETGKVRALLCSPCNTSLGGFKESIISLQNAITYIKIHNN